MRQRACKTDTYSKVRRTRGDAGRYANSQEGNEVRFEWGWGQGSIDQGWQEKRVCKDGKVGEKQRKERASEIGGATRREETESGRGSATIPFCEEPTPSH